MKPVTKRTPLLLIFVSLFLLFGCGSSEEPSTLARDRDGQAAETSDELAEESEPSESDEPEPPEGIEKLVIEELDGGSIVTQLGYGFAINKGSSLRRKSYVLDDEECPVDLTATGVATKYGDRSYSFVPTGDLLAKVDIAAFEVRYLLFDIWGEHLKTLSATEVRDIAAESSFDLEQVGTWRSSENEVSEYLSVVSYVARVRTAEGKGWTANTPAILKKVSDLDLKPQEEDLNPDKDE